MAFGPLVLAILTLWWVVSTLNQIVRGIQDIAATLRRIEQKGQNPTA